VWALARFHFDDLEDRVHGRAALLPPEQAGKFNRALGENRGGWALGEAAFWNWPEIWASRACEGPAFPAGLEDGHPDAPNL
jgi:hypothetical protein